MTNWIRRLALAFAAMFMLAGLQPAQAQVLAKVNGVTDTTVLIAFMAKGDKPVLDALNKAALNVGLKTSMSDDAKPYLMVVMPDGFDPKAFWPFYRDVLAGKFGKVSVEAIVTPRNVDPKAKDFLDSARVVPSGEVSEAAAPSRLMAGTKDHPTPMVVIGFISTGSEADMVKVEGEAKKAGLVTTRSKGDKGEPDVIVIASSSGDPAKFWSLWRSVTSGKLGKLGNQLIVVPTNFDPKMEDYLNFARVYDASVVIVP